MKKFFVLVSIILFSFIYYRGYQQTNQKLVAPVIKTKKYSLQQPVTVPGYQMKIIGLKSSIENNRDGVPGESRYIDVNVDLMVNKALRNQKKPAYLFEKLFLIEPYHFTQQTYGILMKGKSFTSLKPGQRYQGILSFEFPREEEIDTSNLLLVYFDQSKKEYVQYEMAVQ